MTKITDTAFARLEAEGRLVDPVLKAPTRKAGRSVSGDCLEIRAEVRR